MEDINKKYGSLLTPDAKIHRQYFREMCKLIGIRVIYRAPKPNKHYTIYAEIDGNYEAPMLVGCIFDSHPTQQTMKKLGWVAELTEQACIISVDYDLPGLQVGALFIVPSGLDDGKARLFRVTKMSTIMMYPSSVTCEIVPEYEDTYNPANDEDYTSTDFNLLASEEEPMFIETLGEG